MKTKQIYTAAAFALMAFGFSANASAAGGTVSYSCQGGKNVSVSYDFNSAGVPTTARANLQGRNVVMRYDMNRSDNVDTFMQGNGYILGTDALDSRNYRGKSINITAPNGQMLFKSCSPREGGRHDADNHNERGSRSGQVRYVCQSGSGFDATYRFNSAGVPTDVSFKANGRRITLPYDMNASDNVETLFSGRGYRFGAEYIDSRNYRRQSVSTVTDPSNRILYKDCSAR